MSEKKNQALKSIFRGGAVVFLGFIIQKFSGLIYRLLVGRELGPEVYGIISVMVSVYAVTSNIGTLGMNIGVQKFISSYRTENEIEKIRGVTKSALLLVTPFNLIVSIALFFGASWISTNIFHEPRITLPLKMVALALPFSVYTDILSNIPDAYEKMRYNIAVNKIWVNLSKITLAAPLVYLGHGLLGAAFAYTFAMASGVIIAYHYSNKLIGRRWLFKPSDYEFKQLSKFSAPLMFSGIFSIILGNIDTFMIQFFRGSSSVGLYNAAFPLAVLLTLGPSMFSSIFLSNASKLIAANRLRELRNVYKSTTKWVLIVTFPIFLVMLAFPKIILIIFGKQYYAAAPALQILSVGFMAGAITGPFRRLFQADNRTKLVLWQSVILAISNAALNLILIPRLGITGAAYASSLAYLISAFYGLYFMNKHFNLLPFKKSSLKILLAGSISMLLAYLINNLLFKNTPLWFFAITASIFGTLYGTILLISGTVEEDDLTIMRAIKEKTGLEIEFIEKLIQKFS